MFHPTHGIFRGRAASELTVAVRVTPSQGAPSLDQELPIPEDWSTIGGEGDAATRAATAAHQTATNGATTTGWYIKFSSLMIPSVRILVARKRLRAKGRSAVL